MIPLTEPLAVPPLRRRPLPRPGSLRLGLPVRMLWAVALIVLSQPMSWSLLGIIQRDDPNSWMLLGYTVLSALAYWRAVRWLPLSVTPFIFIVFFLVSYPLRVVVVEQSIDLNNASGDSTFVGGFGFSTDEYVVYYLASLAGLAGLLAGAGVVLHLTRSLRLNLNREDNRRVPNPSSAYLLWLIATISVSLTCFGLGIGLAGIQPPRLPLHLTGFLNYLRLAILPLAGLILFGFAYDRRDKGVVVAMLIFLFVYGAVAVMMTLSKVAVMYALSPYVFYLLLRGTWNVFTRRILIGSFVAILLVLPITYFGAMVLRDEAWSNQKGLRSDAFKDTVTDHLGSEYSATGLWQITLSAFGSRVTGGSELMAVLAANPYPIERSLALLLGRGAAPDSGVSSMFTDIFGVTLISSGEEGGLYTGKAFGLFGVLFLGHSYLLMFLGSAFFAGGLVWLELLARRYGNEAFACGLAFLLALAFWESGFDSLVYYPPVLVCFFAVLHRIK